MSLRGRANSRPRPHDQRTSHHCHRLCLAAFVNVSQPPPARSGATPRPASKSTSREVPVDKGNRHGALSDCGCAALDRVMAHVTRSEEARNVRFEVIEVPVERPSLRRPAVVKQIWAGDQISGVVPNETQLSLRTFCTFPGEFSSFSRQGADNGQRTDPWQRSRPRCVGRDPEAGGYWPCVTRATPVKPR
jgi:hypothetical protein